MVNNSIAITAVIPTRNRIKDLQKCLESLRLQKHILEEVIVVDSSDHAIEAEFVREHLGNISFTIIQSIPSVCIQRNLGVSAAATKFIFLCDDDVEAPPNYLSLLVDYINSNSDCDAVTGLFLERDKNGDWIAERPQKNRWSLLFAYVFQLSVWGSLEHIKDNWWTKKLKAFYARRQNTYSKAGWPINTDFTSDLIKTNIHSLGASLCRKASLQMSAYNEVLGPFGIGDNYGVSLGFDNQPGIHLLRKAKVFHHKSGTNRLAASTAYYRRVLALDLFLAEKKQFSRTNRSWLIWSLKGNAILFLFKLKPKMFLVNLKLIFMLLFRRNPYVAGSKKNKKTLSLNPF